jgi:hypothetical protein
MMERRLAALGHVVVDYDRYCALLRDVETLKQARELARRFDSDGPFRANLRDLLAVIEEPTT